MKLYKMTYTDSAGVAHVEWFGAKSEGAKRRNELRLQVREAEVRGFAYNEIEVDVPKGKKELIDFLTELTGGGAPAWSKGKISPLVATTDPAAYNAA